MWIFRNGWFCITKIEIYLQNNRKTGNNCHFKGTIVEKIKKDNYLKRNCVILGAYIQIWKKISSLKKFMRLTK